LKTRAFLLLIAAGMGDTGISRAQWDVDARLAASARQAAKVDE